jgi:hypothetical protein
MEFRRQLFRHPYYLVLAVPAGFVVSRRRPRGRQSFRKPASSPFWFACLVGDDRKDVWNGGPSGAGRPSPPGRRSRWPSIGQMSNWKNCWSHSFDGGVVLQHSEQQYATITTTSCLLGHDVASATLLHPPRRCLGHAVTTTTWSRLHNHAIVSSWPRRRVISTTLSHSATAVTSLSPTVSEQALPSPPTESSLAASSPTARTPLHPVNC